VYQSTGTFTLPVTVRRSETSQAQPAHPRGFGLGEVVGLPRQLLHRFVTQRLSVTGDAHVRVSQHSGQFEGAEWCSSSAPPCSPVGDLLGVPEIPTRRQDRRCAPRWRGGPHAAGELRDQQRRGHASSVKCCPSRGHRLQHTPVPVRRQGVNVSCTQTVALLSRSSTGPRAPRTGR
jgi:hypothetical protein